MARRTDRDRAVQAPLARGDVIPNYRELLARLPAVVYVAEPGESGAWLYVSAQIETILGFSPEEWCADPELWARRLHPHDRAAVLGIERGPLAGAEHSGTSEYRLAHRDGRWVWIRDEAVLVAEADGARLWHGVLSDISEEKRAEEELERRAAQQAAVARFGEHALEGRSPTELMQEAVKAAATMLGTEIGGVFELIAGEDHLVLRATVGYPESGVGRLRIPAGRASHAGFTALTRQPVVVEDWATESRFTLPPTLRDAGARSGAYVPIDGGSEPFGVLGVQSLDLRVFSDIDIDFLHALANVLADALERQATEDRIRHQALHDPLTGLPNRTLFLDRLEHAIARQRRRQSLAAVLFLDLDRFKLINDSLGHQIGDELLAAAAPRLRQAVRATDTVSRFGGDEFGILLEDVGAERDAIEMAERIAGVFTRPFVLAGSEHFVTTSIGIALARGSESAGELIRNADAAMYRAKEHGGARYEVFDEEMRERAIHRLAVESDLRRALGHGELRLAYQPVVTLPDRSMVSVEALVRWAHPSRGLILPEEFIEVAEEDGMIEPIGHWVLEQACRQAAQWQRERPQTPPPRISVNLSPVQFLKRDLPDAVAEVLRMTGLDPAWLSLELTEPALLRDGRTVREMLRRLKALGVRLVLDDFGTGCSSLADLANLPLDALKVDRSFVDGLGSDARDTAVTEAIVAMSRALALEVIAEGVETARQVSELTRLGCRLAQGFYFSPAVEAEAIARVLHAGPTWPAAGGDHPPGP